MFRKLWEWISPKKITPDKDTTVYYKGSDYLIKQLYEASRRPIGKTTAQIPE